MSKKSKKLLRVLSLLILLTSFVPLNHNALAATPLPPVDMFQLPWEQGQAWVAIDGFDDGSTRAVGSPHNYLNGGAIDFAPHNNMIKGENTSKFWVAAAADGRIVEISKCHMKIAHADGWVSEYQHLANIQVKLGDTVVRNQRLAVIANASTQPVCLGSEPPDIPHLHFVLRPTMVGVTFAGWEFRYNWFWNNTTFRKNNQTVGLYKPLLNVLESQPTPTPAIPPTTTPDGQTTATPGNPPTATPTAPSGPYVSTTVNVPNIHVGDSALVTVSLHNVPGEGYASAEFTCAYHSSLVETSNVVITNLFGADAASALSNTQSGFILALAGSKGNKATTSGPVFTFNVKGLQSGQTALECTARVSKGDNVLTPLPSIGTDLTILESFPTPTLTASPPPVVSSTPVVIPSATPTAHASDWLTFTNFTYGFQFQFPMDGLLVAGGDDNYTRIDLTIAPGTNLREKYLEMIVAENAGICQSPLATQSMLATSETVVINGNSFLKQTGGDAGAGNIHEWVAYSTFRDNVCVSLDFILHSLNPGNFPVPPPVFEYAAESLVFEQIVSTYVWLTMLPTATPTFTSVPVESPTPTFTFTPAASPTAIPISGAILTGQVIASKVVTVRLYDMNDTLVASVNANPDGTFKLDIPAGAYTIMATANGFLRVQASITLADGESRVMPLLTLLAGDIDDNNIIDQFDAMTIGFNYNTVEPPGADLNSDGIINVIDLELLARNYHKTGPVAWQ